MKTIVIEASEIVDPEITVVSLVKRGANRSPFKILKSEEYPQQQNVKDQQPDNGDVDERYPFGRPSNPLNLRKSYSLDSMLVDAWNRRSRRGW